MYNLFLTAPSGTGKSTIIEKILCRLNVSIGGFQVKRYLNKKREMCFDMISLMDKKSNNIIGECMENKKTLPNLYTFENKGVEILNTSLTNSDLIILDEIGFLEEKAEKFKSSVRNILNSDKVVLGVLKEFDSPFLNEIRSRKDITLLNVTLKNRDYITNHILNILSSWNIPMKLYGNEMIP
ncbi:MAG: nucleoside-triphosphatase [Clostridium sp.]|uniref:nucleoside-triphosphatase n=1 Tax=Clostridium sp. TaxID=1506 RepID=UPI002911A228|nr:nucleoside-triphosphatase [Clostridium sp.]EJE7233471.1 nucleoside-triphosphatase [Clostridium botulinum]MDU7251784.1 nucleoside-triphosphatase [Clostridium sp.]